MKIRLAKLPLINVTTFYFYATIGKDCSSLTTTRSHGSRGNWISGPQKLELVCSALASERRWYDYAWTI